MIILYIMAFELTGETKLKDDTAYVSPDFINVIELCQADMGGDKIFNGFKIIFNDPE